MDGGWGVEPAEVDALLDAVVGDRNDTDLAHWYAHLSSRQALLTAAASRVADLRAGTVAGMHAEGLSYARIAGTVGMSRARVQQLVERGGQTTSRSQNL